MSVITKINRASRRGVYSQCGFTLIEVLVSLVIVSVAILSLGGFSLGVVSSGQLDRERLTAVHLAEQVLEFWQHDVNDFAPQISNACNLSANPSLPPYAVSIPCVPSSGTSISYTVNMDVVVATAPLPTNPNADGSNSGAFAVRAMLGGAGSSPIMKVVTVSWNHKGKSRSVYLTGLASP